jgi:pyruvoyl-dependent arginine decarboxylase (PvlArgDC)
MGMKSCIPMRSFDMDVKLDDKILKEAIALAVLQSMGEENRDKVIADAVHRALTSRGEYGNRKDMFTEAVEATTREVVKEMVYEHAKKAVAARMGEFHGIITEALDAFFMEAKREEIVKSLADSFISRFSRF